MLKAFKASVEAMMTQEEPVLRFSKFWRLLMVAGGLFAPGLAVMALMEKSNDALSAEKLSWASFSFVVFSGTCLVAALVGNVRSIGSLVEKSTFTLLALLFGVAFFIPGFALVGYEDEDTAFTGKLFMKGGAFWTIFWTPIFYKLVSKWSTLEDHELSVALMALFKALPGTVASQVYLSTAAMRCVLAADDESPLYEQCGNPLSPTYQINMLLLMVWFLAYFCAPLIKDMKTKTWGDMMVLKMGKMEGFQFSLGSILGTVTWVEFAFLNEDGESITDFMATFGNLFHLFYWSLTALVIFDIIVRPRLCPSSATTTSNDDNDAISLSHSNSSTSTSMSISNANNSNAFNMGQVTAATFSVA